MKVPILISIHKLGSIDDVLDFISSTKEMLAGYECDINIEDSTTVVIKVYKIKNSIVWQTKKWSFYMN